MTTTPVSVVIPTYDRWPLVLEAVDSALEQWGEEPEVIVVDDGSTDGTAERLRRTRPTVRVVEQGNRGRSAARNAGIDAATRELVAFLDADDVYEPWHLSQCLAALQATSDPRRMVASPAQLWDPGAGRARPIPVPSFRNVPVADAVLTGTVLPVQGLVVPTEVATRIRFPEELDGSEDWVFLVRLTRRVAVHVLERPSVRIREHEDRSLRDVRWAVAQRDAAVGLLLAAEDLGPREELLARAGTHRYAAARLYEAGRMREARRRLREVRRLLGPSEGFAWTWRLWVQSWLGGRIMAWLRGLRRTWGGIRAV